MKRIEKKSFYNIFYTILLLGLFLGYLSSRINKLTYENKNLCNKLNYLYKKKTMTKESINE